MLPGTKHTERALAKMRRGPIELRFWSKVNKTDECWLWTACVDRWGYGRFKIGEKSPAAHKVSFEWAYGKVPKGLGVLHSCDTPACVKPAHLFAGTQKQNADDMTRKGRGRKGIPRPVLSAAVISDIVAERKTGWSMKALSTAFSVNLITIRRVLKNRDPQHPCSRTFQRGES